MRSSPQGYDFVALTEAGVAVLDCEHKTPPDVGAGHPYIAIPNLVDGRLDLTQVRRITDEHLRQWTRRTAPQGGDIIVTRRGRVGDTAVIPKGLTCAIGQNLVLLRSDGRQVSQAYLRWATRGPLWKREVDRLRNVGAVFDSLNVRDIARLRIPVPPPADQRRITAVLGALDDKIDSNERLARSMIELVETAFEFIRLDPEASTMVLGDLGIVRGGGTPSTTVDEYWEPGEIVWVTPKDMTALRTPLIAGSKRLISASGLANSSAKLLPRGTVLYTSRATLGHVAIADCSLATNQGFIAIEPDGFSSEFVLMTLRDRNEAIVAQASGSTFLEVNKTNFKAVDCMRPSAAALEEFDAVAGPAMRKVAAVERETRTLRAIRDELLPKLVSGEIRIPPGGEREDPASLAA